MDIILVSTPEQSNPNRCFFCLSVKCKYYFIYTFSKIHVIFPVKFEDPLLLSKTIIAQFLELLKTITTTLKSSLLT